MGIEFKESYSRYIEDLPKYIPLNPVEVDGKGAEIISQASAIVILSLLHASALGLSDLKLPEGLKTPKNMLADRIKGRLKTGIFPSTATRAHWEIKELAAVEEIGEQIVRQLKGDNTAEVIHFEHLINHGAVKLANIYYSFALELPLEARKAYAVSITETAGKSDYKLVAFKAGLIVNYQQVEGWRSRFVTELSRP
jgi:hypothetical protein